LQRHRVIAANRNQPVEMLGVYRVLREFRHLNSDFAPQALVSREVIDDGALYRLALARYIVADSGAAAVAA
jgi:hypothetical protein